MTDKPIFIRHIKIEKDTNTVGLQIPRLSFEFTNNTKLGCVFYPTATPVEVAKTLENIAILIKEELCKK